MEFINATEISPLISKVQIKVCYVGQDPNRNNTVITKEVATNLGKKLPGSPIVGYFNHDSKDFEGHNREIVIDEEAKEFKLLDTTKPYGFVDINAKVWFEKFTDDGVEHEYLCTEGYIWTGAYPESERIIEQGNNQSMELHSKSEKGFWTENKNSGKRIFIINDGLIEKLCILGQDVEPCFEGSQIKAKFSLENSPEFIEFKNTMFSMINEIKDTLIKGGSNKVMEDNQILEQQEFAKKDEEEKNKDKKEQETSSSGENGPAEKDEKKDKEEEKDKKKKNYNLDEIAEYVALQLQFSALQTKYAELETQNKNLTAELDGLRDFKLKTDRKQKQDMIDSFYMLSEEDKKDIVSNIDTYSLDDIEAKLSILCVRNKVNFNKEEENISQYSFNINQSQDNTDDAPEWVKAVRQKSN